MVKNPPAMLETWVWFLDWEDLLEEVWLPVPVFSPGESPWTEKPGGLQSLGSQRVGHDWVTKHSTQSLSLSGLVSRIYKELPQLTQQKCLEKMSQKKILLFSQWVVSDSLQPYGLQHARLPCPSPSPGACSNSLRWVGDAIRPSHPLSSPSPPACNLSQHQDLF